MPPVEGSRRPAPAPVRAAGRAAGARAAPALCLGVFAVGTGEFVVMGLLPDIARDLGTTVPAAGGFVSAYALGVVLGAPVLAVLTAAMDRRTLLSWLLACVVAANLGTAAAPDAAALGWLRWLAGVPHATFFGVAALVASSLAAPGRGGRAIGHVMAGLALASVAGVPLATWAGQAFGWRAAFALVGALAGAGWLAVRAAVPPMPAVAAAGRMGELAALARPQVWATLGVAAVGFGGMFAVLSYVKPLLVEAAGLGTPWVPWVLALFGVGMLVGTTLGARFADRSAVRTIGCALAWSTVVLLAIPFTAASPLALALNLFFVGTMAALGPALQVRLIALAAPAQTLPAALNHSAFNLANAIGAWAGGAAIAAGWGWASTGLVGALLAAAGIVVFLAADRAGRRQA